MTATTPLQLPLANGLKWLSPEIDGLLQRVRLLLDQQQEIGSGERNFKPVFEDVRQVAGALAMVGADGGRILAQEMLDALLIVDSGTLAEGDEALAAISGSTLQLSDYLDLLQRGQPDCAAVLQPAISELRLASKRTAVTEAELFVRQMLLRAPVLFLADASARPPGSAAIVANKLLTPFQGLLLQWLKGIDVNGTLLKLRKCSDQVAAYAAEPNIILLWSAFSAAIDSLLAMPESDSLEAKRWMGRISSHLKLLTEQGEAAAAVVAPELAWRLLGHTATISHAGVRWDALKSQLPLADALPVEPALSEARRRLRGPNTRLLDKVADEVRADLVTVKDDLDLAMRAGALAPDALGQLKTRLQRIASTLSLLGLSQLDQVLRLQASELETLLPGGDDSRGQWMRIATSLLRVEHSLENALFRPLRQSHHGDANAPPDELVDAVPHSRDFRESRRALLGEMLVDIAKLKSELDGYLKGGELRDAGGPAQLLGEVASGLVILNETGAAHSFGTLRQWLGEAGPEALRADDRLAARFAEAVALGEVYLEALRDELPQAEVLERRLAQAGTLLPVSAPPQAEPEAAPVPERVAATEDAVSFVSANIAATVLSGETVTLSVESVRKALEAAMPPDALTPEPVIPTPPAAPETPAPALLEAGSPLLADTGFNLLPEFSASITPMAFSAAPLTTVEPVVESPIAAPAPPAPAAPAASSEPDPIDPEIREIFIEEAQEVVDTLRKALPGFRRDPLDSEICADIRRAFHTLKGSGRMVGATRIGEFGWSVEHLLNRCIEGALPVNDTVVGLIEQAIAVLPQLLSDFREGNHPVEADDPAHALAARAHFLASGRAPEMVEPEVLEVFRTDALDRLADLERALAEDPTLPVDSESVRALHTLKGSAAVVNAEGLSRIAAALEATLKELRDGEHPMPPEVRAVVSELLPSLRQWVHDTGRAPLADAAEWLARIEALRAFLPPPVETGNATRRESVVNLAFDRLKVVEESLIAWMAQPADAAHCAAMADASEALAAVSQDCLPLTRAGAALAERLRAGETVPPEGAFFQSLVGVLERCYQYLDAFREGRLPESGQELVDHIRDLRWQPEGTPAALLDAMPGEASLPPAQDGFRAEPPPLSDALLTLDTDLPPLVDEPGEAPPAPEFVGEPYAPSAQDAPSASANTYVAMDGARLADTAAEAPLPIAEQAASEDLDPELREVFLAEADELLDTLQQGHAQWRGEGMPPEGLSRAAHTLAGSARLCGYSALGDAAHDIERRLLRLDGSAEASEAAHVYLGASLPLFFGAVEALRAAPVPASAPDASTEPAFEPVALTGPAFEPAAEAPVEPVFDAPYPPAPEPFAAIEPVAEPEQAVEWQPAPATSPSMSEREDLDAELVGIFVAEASENLETISGTVQQWQRGEDAAVAELQRALHTLKGGARMSGFVAMGDLVHDLESRVVDLLARGLRPRGVEQQRLAVLLDALHRMHDALTRGDTSAERAIAIFNGAELRVQQLHDQPEELSAPAPAWQEPAVAEERPDALIAVVGQQSLLDAEATAAGFSPELFWRPPAEAGVSVLRRELARVPVEKLDAMLNEAGEISIYRSRLEQQNAALVGQLSDMAQTITRLREQLRYMELETEAQIAARGFSAQSEIDDDHQQDFDPLELDRYTRMQELSRALAEAVSDLGSIKQGMDVSATEAQGLLLQQGRINTSVQQGLMGTLMVPFSRQVSRLQRVARQTAQEEGKQVELHFEGAESELDRNVLEAMTAPLEHLLRNAVVHGVESPEQRRNAGKPLAGQVRVSIQREGTLLGLEIADDGAGLNFAAIRRKAIQQGLMPEGLQLADDEVARFIFESGFSTAETLTQNAGRGVGMDVVASEIKQLGGTLELRSVPDQGTRFIIRLPLSLALSQALIVGVGEETYALPLPAIEGIARVPRALALQVAGEESVTHSYGGHDYRVRALAELIDLTYVVPEEARTVLAVLVRLGEGIGGGERRVALLVDRLLGNREIVSKAVGPQLSSISGVAGATIISSGEVVLILDPAALVIDRARRRLIAEANAARSLQERKAESLGRLIMVVDDSITMRRVAERLLGRHGYRVITAKDGVDAMTQLQHESPAAILLDIEMPRADGFEVATFVRSEDRIRETPIIMITSRSGDKHRARAATLGVDRYLIKPYQEEELLGAIRSLLQQREAEQA